MAAAMSAAPSSATALTPPSSSHGNEDPWAYTVGDHEPTKKIMSNPNLSLSSRDRSATTTMPANETSPQTSSSSSASSSSPDMGSLPESARSAHVDCSPPWGRDEDESAGIDPSAAAAIATVTAGVNGDGLDKLTPSGEPDDPPRRGHVKDESSMWIHRDKLARIENEELHAAGVLPKPVPRPRKDRSTDRLTGRRSPDRGGVTRPKTRGSDGPTAATAAAIVAATTSRIPIAKHVLAPLDGRASASTPPDGGNNNNNEGDSHQSSSSHHGKATTTTARSRSMSVSQGDHPGTPPRAQHIGPSKRSVTAELSPKKQPTAPRRPPPANKTTSAAPRPRTRGGIEARSGSLTNRPATRSGDLSPPGSNSKKPEGEPPWMVSAYKPDPRLPPDQQLLPTVARRLQQEKWEREGKFGSVYDKEFRPLTDDGLLEPPEPSPRAVAAPPSPPPVTAGNEEEEDGQEEGRRQNGPDWPLRPDPSQTSAPAPNRGSSYSTMPKISIDNKHGSLATTPLQSPRPPQTEVQRQLSQRSNLQVIRLPDEPESAPASPEAPPEKVKASCLCCIVM